MSHTRLPPGPSYEGISKNSIDASLEETFRATPAAFDGHLLLRSDKFLCAHRHAVVNQPVPEPVDPEPSPA